MVVIASILLGIAALLIVFGLALFSIGLRRRVVGDNSLVAPKTATQELIEFMKKFFKIIFDRNSSKAEVMMASGAFFVLLGIIFILAALGSYAAVIAGSGTGGGGSSPSTTPSVPAPST